MNIYGHVNNMGIVSKLMQKESLSLCFCGKEGIGKKLVAFKIIEDSLHIENPKSSPNVMVIQNEGEVIKVDEIRKIKEFSSLKSFSSGKRVVIIDNAHNMNNSAQNALLKLLEEPPMGEIIILITSEYEKLLPTIRSRVTAINFEPLDDFDMKKIDDFSKETLLIAEGSVSFAKKIEHIDKNEMKQFAKNYIFTLGDQFLEGREISEQNFLVYGKYTTLLMFDLIKMLNGEKCEIEFSRDIYNNLNLSVDELIKKIKHLDGIMRDYKGVYNKKILLTEAMFI